ncbi:VWA domain-containing protein [Candidatus Pacearchaeota archaeon]|nr:VWA domain-containing protein [Candidatus Pacearchaeota archaeon]
MIFSFENPAYLALILVVPLLIFIHFYSIKKHDMKALKFANFEAISRISGVQFFSKNITILYLSVILIVILSLASAGMHVNVVKSASSFSFAIAIDSSQSMETQDIGGARNRLDAAKGAAKVFVDESPVSTEIGVLSFSGVPFIEQEMTSNKAPVKAAIDRIALNRVGGTNIMNAMIAASTMFDKDDEKAVILISDGQISVDTVEAIIKYANQNGIVISAIGVGSLEGGENKLGYISKLDEDSLKAMAHETEGKFAIVGNEEEFSNSILDILKLTKRRVSVDMTYPLIFLSALLFITIFVLLNFKYQNIP